jgi:hypothetical protein
LGGSFAESGKRGLRQQVLSVKFHHSFAASCFKFDHIFNPAVRVVSNRVIFKHGDFIEWGADFAGEHPAN